MLFGSGPLAGACCELRPTDRTVMIRFRTIESNPAANTNKPTIVPQPVPADDDRKIERQRPRNPEKSASLSPAEKPEHD